MQRADDARRSVRSGLCALTFRQALLRFSARAKCAFPNFVLSGHVLHPHIGLRYLHHYGPNVTLRIDTRSAEDDLWRCGGELGIGMGDETNREGSASGDCLSEQYEFGAPDAEGQFGDCLPKTIGPGSCQTRCLSVSPILRPEGRRTDLLLVAHTGTHLSTAERIAWTSTSSTTSTPKRSWITWRISSTRSPKSIISTCSSRH